MSILRIVAITMVFTLHPAGVQPTENDVKTNEDVTAKLIAMEKAALNSAPVTD